MTVFDWPPSFDDPEEFDTPFHRRLFLRHLRREFDFATAKAQGRKVGPTATPVRNRWLPLGPMTTVQAHWPTARRITGRVRAIAVHPDGERVYAAAANGGVWYSSDSGRSWRSIGGEAATDRPGVTRPAHRQACGAILAHFDPTAPDDPSKDLVVVGTGEITPEGDVQPGSQLGGVGILIATGPAASSAPDPWTLEAPNLAGHGVYGLARDPGGTALVAATSIGLFERPSGAGAGTAWTRIAGAPFDSLEGECTDVLWTPASGAIPTRLWVWSKSGDETGLWVRSGSATDFEKVSVPGGLKRRGILAASDPPAKVYVFNDRHWPGASPQKPPGLFRIDNSGVADPTSTEVNGVPDILENQGFYDMALAVDPGNPDRVLLGGMTFRGETPDGESREGGAILSAEVGMKDGELTYGHAEDPRMLGVGVHADIHDLVFAKGGAQLWATCDGGVYRSDHPDQFAAFVPCNDRLPVVETNYLASHPTCEGYVVAGLQDNGILERLSNGVWEHTGGGDGGGVAFDPSDTKRYVRQYHDADWTANSGGNFPKLLDRGGGDTLKTDREDEFEKAAFYSMPGAIRFMRPAVAPATTPTEVGQILIGTDRVWYTQDWSTSWITLPTATDPITSATYNRSQDVLPDAIRVCRWATPDVAWILGERMVVRLQRSPGSTNAGGNGSWIEPAEILLDMSEKAKKNETDARGPIHDTVGWTDLAVNLEADGSQRGSMGAVYIGTTGNPDDADVDTLWWFDGTDTWHPTGLRSKGAPAPVTAILCERQNPDHVYVGTTIGVWRGTRNLTSDPPEWDWEALVSGLPEAVVEDLSLFDDGGVRLLRAAIASRGIWELEIDADVAEITYIRAHEDDLRRRAAASLKGRDGKTDRSWHGSPDIRPRLAPAVIPVPGDLPWDKGTNLYRNREAFRRFQAALRSQANDDRVRPNARWGPFFAEVLRDLGAPVDAASKKVQITDTFWNSVMVDPHRLAEPWGAAGSRPSEADLHDLTPSLSEGSGRRTSCDRPAAELKVDVVVHHRGVTEIDGADVRVTLLKWMDPSPTKKVRPEEVSKWAPGAVPWAAAVEEVLNSAGGTTGLTFGGGWEFVLPGANKRLDLSGQELDVTRAGIATFDLDLTGVSTSTVVLLVAVIRAGSDISLTSAPVKDLIVANSGVAARSLRVG